MLHSVPYQAFWGRYVLSGERPRQRLLSFGSSRELRFAWSLDGEEREVVITIRPGERGFTAVEVEFMPDARPGTVASVFWARALENLVHHLNGWRLNPFFD